jgi:hypothetical protein
MRDRIRRWLLETHSPGFELRRHFFRRFFDTDLISDPNQAKVFAGGVLAIIISIGFVYAQAYYHKYLQFENLDDFSPYRRASLADFLFMITIAMNAVALISPWPACRSACVKSSSQNSPRCWPSPR